MRQTVLPLENTHWYLTLGENCSYIHSGRDSLTHSGRDSLKQGYIIPSLDITLAVLGHWNDRCCHSSGEDCFHFLRYFEVHIILQSKENTWVRVTSSNDQTIKANKHRFPSHTYLIMYSEKRSCTPGNLQMRCPAFLCSATLSKPDWDRGGFLLVQTTALHSNCKMHIQDFFFSLTEKLGILHNTTSPHGLKLSKNSLY